MNGLYNLFVYLSGIIGISIEALFMLGFLIPCIVFFAADFKLGIISTLIVSSGIFMWFYQSQMQTDQIILIILLLVVLLSFTLYFVSAKATRQGLFI